MKNGKTPTLLRLRGPGLSDQGHQRRAAFKITSNPSTFDSENTQPLSRRTFWGTKTAAQEIMSLFTITVSPPSKNDKYRRRTRENKAGKRQRRDPAAKVNPSVLSQKPNIGFPSTPARIPARPTSRKVSEQTARTPPCNSHASRGVRGQGGAAPVPVQNSACLFTQSRNGAAPEPGEIGKE